MIQTEVVYQPTVCMMALMSNDITPEWAGRTFAAVDFGKDHGKAQKAAFALAIADGFVLDRASWVARKPGHRTMKLVWNMARQANRSAYTWAVKA